jgi:general secretion pathway protein A
MYEAYYGFREKPFNLTPDPKYLFLSARHTEAFAHLEFGRRERGGFIVITGEVGTGKTTLARYFLGNVGDQAATAVVLYPALTAAELLRSILDDLHVPAAGDSLKDLVDALHRFLLDSHAQGRNVILLIDEAQDLSAEVLEQIRLLSNLETDTEKLIQIVLMGQSELHEMLEKRELRQLAQRVTARYHLAPLNREETEEYVRHRLRVAGGEDRAAFSAGAIGAIHRASSGVPRLVNLICDRALLAGYVKGTREIDAAMVRRAAREVRGEVAGAHGGFPAATLGWGVAGVLAAVVAAGAFSRAPSAATASLPPPTSAPAPTVAASPPAAGVLDAFLLDRAPTASLEHAAAAIGSLWSAGPLERTAARADLEQIRRFDLPAVLALYHPSRRATIPVALLKLSADSALLADGRGGTLRVPVSELERRFTRDVVFLWRDVEATGVGADAARTEAFAHASLTRLGYGSGALSSEVARFQRDNDLVADGVVGGQTLMAFYALGLYERPRLSGAIR